MSEEQLSEELAALEAALGSLTPVPSNVQRDRVMFLAGCASAEQVGLPRRRPLAAWLWPCATSASLLAALVFGVLWSAGDKPIVVERVVYVPAARASAPLQASAAKPSSSSSSFAKWQVAPSTRKNSRGALQRPDAAPRRRVPGNSDSGDCLHTADSVT